MSIEKYKRKKRFEIIDRRRQVAHLLLTTDLTEQEIAKKLGISRSTMDLDCRTIREKWQAEIIKDMDEKTREQLAKIDTIEHEAWKQWEKVNKRIKTTTKRATKEDGTSIKVGVERSVEPLLPDSKYLDIIHKCIETKCKIFGIKPPDVLDIGPNMADAIERIYERRKQRLQDDSKNEESEDT